VSLNHALSLEVIFPTYNTCWASIKYQAIPLLPDMPSCYDEDFHEEIMVEVLFSQIYHVKEWSSSLPLNANLLPTGSCKGTAKEKMNGHSESTLQVARK